jgi:hypothetical protein
MLEPDSLPRLRKAMQERAAEDRVLLDALRAEVRPLKTAVRRIQLRSTTSMSLVASDSGNNKIQLVPRAVAGKIERWGEDDTTGACSPRRLA